jgi:4-amino-4-deoxy-L-arabinose transferase-like glycosyltransferase
VTTTTFDLSTSALCWLLVRAMIRRSGRSLLAAGVVAGLGCEAKPQVAFVAIVAVAVLTVIGPRWPFRSPWLVAAVAAGVRVRQLSRRSRLAVARRATVARRDLFSGLAETE